VAAAAAALGLALWSGAAPTARVQEPARLPVSELTLPVVDLSLTEATLDDSVQTAESARRVRVTLAADVLFAFDRAALSPGAQRRLGDVARRIRAARPQQVDIDGHTDAEGSERSNDRLSRRRAESVADALRDLLGPAAPTLASAGHGERDPVAPDERRDGSDDPRGRARNRRVTVSFDR
jgi:outer membrane protein OmpA-like peptidoglycan-associated protein